MASWIDNANFWASKAKEEVRRDSVDSAPVRYVKIDWDDENDRTHYRKTGHHDKYFLKR
jgi:hypothetical protein